MLVTPESQAVSHFLKIDSVMLCGPVAMACSKPVALKQS